MPPRISSSRGGPRGARSPRGGHPGAGEIHGSQPGGLSSINPGDNVDTIALIHTPTSTPQVNLPNASRGQPSGNRGRGAPGSPLSAAHPIATTITTDNPGAIQMTASTPQANPLNVFRGLPSSNRGRGRGRGRGRDAPGSPSSAAIPHPIATTITTDSPGAIQMPASTPQADPPNVFRGLPSGNRDRGRRRGVGRGSAQESPSSPVITQVAAATITIDSPDATQTPAYSPQGFRGRPHDNRGRSRGRGGRGAPGSPSSTTTAVISAVDQSFLGHSGHRGGAGGSSLGYPNPFQRAHPSRGHGGSRRPPTSGLPADTLDIPEHIKTFGAKRPDFGTGGRCVKIIINAFPIPTVPDLLIFQYDVVHSGKLPARLNMELLGLLQQEEANIFTPKVVYDGQRILFSTRELPLGPNGSQKFSVSRSRPNGPPKVYDIVLTKTTMINSELLQRYTARNSSHDDNISTILAALNVAVKMGPNQIHPFNRRSFYIPDGRKDIGGGIELWRGIFQSVRPTFDRLIVNIDLSTGMMYKEGPLSNLCIDFFGREPNTSPNAILVPGRTLRDIERIRLQKFLSGVRVTVSTTGDKERVVRGLSERGADTLVFETRSGARMTVANYFQSLNIPLRYPSVICVLVGQFAMVPLELCMVPRGQFMRKNIPDDKVKNILEFSTRKPQDRLQSIRDGLRYLQYGQSEYVRNFGMTIDENPLSTEARVIEPPMLRYHESCRQPSIRPKDGTWNMVDKKFYEPSTIVRWVVVIYDSQRSFSEKIFRETANGFLTACDEVGITVENRNPIFKYENGQGPIDNHLMNAVEGCQRQFGQMPTLIVVVLPNNAGDIYNAVKHFGDITFGIPTQCLKSSNCKRSRSQYWNNVMLKVNVKLGGINVIPDPSSLAAEALADPVHPTLVMGADVMHPPPGVNRPSYTAIIGSVDSHTAKYVATSRAQTGKQEIVNDMQEMCMTILGQYKDYQVNVEKKQFGLSRLIFYRDGVSESQFQHVLNLELPMLKAACEEFKVNPKITLIIVGKRHHIQFFPLRGEGDKNCSAGTVVDKDVTHPTDHDFYLLSHAGILGTSRPAHYSVLYDESGFNADALQSLSYSLCHVYAPSTRSVSVPAPVYYADLVCSRAKTHFDPKEHLTFDDSTTASDSTNLTAFKNGYKPLHANQQKAMYFA